MFEQQRHQQDLRHREQRRPSHQHQGIKRAVALGQDVGHREREGCPDHQQQRQRVGRQARPRRQHDHADECERHAGGRVSDGRSASSGQANSTVKGVAS